MWFSSIRHTQSRCFKSKKAQLDPRLHMVQGPQSRGQLAKREGRNDPLPPLNMEVTMNRSQGKEIQEVNQNHQYLLE